MKKNEGGGKDQRNSKEPARRLEEAENQLRLKDLFIYSVQLDLSKYCNCNSIMYKSS